MIFPSAITIQKKQHFSGHAAGIFCLEQGLSPHTILSGGGDGVVAEWDLRSSANAKGLVKVQGNIFALLLMADKQLVIAGDLHGIVHYNHLEQKAEIHRSTYSGGAIYDIKRVSDNTIAIATGNGNVYIYDVDKFETVAKIAVSDKSIRSITFSAKRQELVFSCSDFNIYVYDANDYTLKYALSRHDNSVFATCYNADETLLFSGSRDAQLNVWDVDNDYALKMRIPAHMYTINHLVCSPDGRFIATAGRDRHIKIWDAEHLHLLKVIDKEKFEGHVNSVNKLFWSKWNNYLISCGDDRSVMVWDISTTPEG